MYPTQQQQQQQQREQSHLVYTPGSDRVTQSDLPSPRSANPTAAPRAAQSIRD